MRICASLWRGMRGTGRYKAVIRGGNWDNGANAGVFALNANNAPSNSNDNVGFRCCRD